MSEVVPRIGRTLISSDADKAEIVDQALLDQFLGECGAVEPFRIEVGLKGDSSLQLHEIRQPFLVIGRRAESDMLLDHWQVSRRHAYLQLIEGRFFCVDLGSRTGTHGGDATERAGWLEPGRAIQVGPYLVRPDLSVTSDRDYPPLPIITWSINGPNDEPSFWTMNRGLALIGRSPACRIRLADSDVSRFHCSLVLTTSGVWVVDLLSQRPVILNGQPIRFGRVGAGDQLQIGQHILTPDYDHSLIKAAPPRTSVARSVFEPPIIASIVEPEPATDHLPALAAAHTMGAPSWNSTTQLSEDQTALKGLDPSVNSLVQQFGAMQQQMFDQFHQTMMMMFEGFAALHRETSGSIRVEFEEVGRLSQEIESLRAETNRLAEATTMSFQQPAFEKANLHQPTHRNGHSQQQPASSPRAEPIKKVVTPLPDPHVDIHAQLCARLSEIAAERQTRWQRILGMMSSRS